MSTEQVVLPDVRVDVRNIGGIDETAVTIPSGVSVLTGRNATNRTSFLQALMAGLGSDRSSLKGDAEEGAVTLEIGDETYTRTLTRHGGTVTFGGDPYLDDPELADLFAFLLENNEARQAVARGDDLREIIMRPIDTDRIEAEIESCKRERDELEDEIDRLDELERERPRLEEERREKREELADAREELADARARLEELDTGVEESRSQKRELEDAFQRVRDARSELEDLEFDLETERSTLAEYEREREELEATLAEKEENAGNPDRLAGRIDELRRRKRSLDDTVSELSSVIGFNQELLEGDGLDVVGTDDPTNALTADSETVCWTCGSEVETEQIEGTLEDLQRLRSEKLDERKEVRAEIDELTDKQSQIQRRKRERQRTKNRLSEIETETETTRARIEELETAIEAKRDEIAELEAEAEEIDVDGHDEALDLHREINGIELRIERLESTIDDLDAEIDDLETAIDDRDELREEREALADRLTELRTRVDRVEEGAVEAFNEHMETVLGILGYDNLDRIWIERRETEVLEGRRKVSRTRFELHIVRSAPDGTAYEDTVDHLSESEREVTGLVFALAGYLVHDVHELVPFVLLDSLESIDSERIARVVDYFREYGDYFVTALLPGDAAALSEEYAYIEDID
ncbi:chromosome segregation protein SMC [Halorubrum sp. 48-1-W]|uniref:archaea-specific SMC-related protein n=1 Tax=Halorubrum sp. 48-1-W TaxID=2249761 RepID=UPI000DCC883D|nr:archaea-specific SMC-related protein [Halorubrum sp. 48-1-W]RAW44535.1 chromosome segregation protein SMC [Halorubrum sp. 48-1-W]